MKNYLQHLLQYVFSAFPAPDNSKAATSLENNPLLRRWIIGGGILAGLLAIVTAISPKFAANIPIAQQPILPMVALLVLAGVAFLYLVGLIPRTSSQKRLMLWILLLGAALRVLMFFSTPILEVDFNRYLWDGAVTAHGFNPYEFSPDEIRASQTAKTVVPPDLTRLSRQPGATIDRINHSYLRTIYPPVTQAAFVIAYWIAPWRLFAWRIVLLIADLATVVILLSLLKYLNLSPLWISIYWLNPLLIKEIFNSGHMDLLVFPFLLGALLLLIRHKPQAAMIPLAFAVGTKIWPVALLPIFLRPLWPNARKMAGAVGIFAILLAVMFAPVYLSGLGESSGFNAYSNRWELNDSAFKLIAWGAIPFLKFFEFHPGHSQFVARVITGLLLFGWIIFLTLQNVREPRRIIDQCLLIVAAMFLLSPTQFPWYATWMIPLLVISPRSKAPLWGKPLLLLTALLPLYYLWHYFDAIGNVDIFNYGIVWIEFVPVWLLLIRDWRRKQKFAIPDAGYQKP